MGAPIACNLLKIVEPMSFQIEFPFTLPRGYLYQNSDGTTAVARMGRMALATALDEIESVQDPRVQANEAFLPLLLLSRVIQLEPLGKLMPEQLAALYVIDLAYLEDLYERVNSPEVVTMGVVCPQCSQQFQVNVSPIGA